MIRFTPVLTVLLLLLAVGCSKPAADNQGGASGDVTKVKFDVTGMT